MTGTDGEAAQTQYRIAGGDGESGSWKKLRSELLEFGRRLAYTVIMTVQVPSHTADVPNSGPLAALLAAVAAEAQPLLAEHRTGRIVINFSGGDKVRIETARFRDVSVGPPAK
jgi:hypothetical protein